MPSDCRNEPEYASYKGSEEIELPKRRYSLINFCTWAVIILVPLANYLLQTMISGSVLKISLVGLLCAAGTNSESIATGGRNVTISLLSY